MTDLVIERYPVGEPSGSPTDMRAATGMICRCAAMTVVPKGVAVNVVGTNFMNDEGFWHVGAMYRLEAWLGKQ